MLSSLWPQLGWETRPASRHRPSCSKCAVQLSSVQYLVLQHERPALVPGAGVPRVRRGADLVSTVLLLSRQSHFTTCPLSSPRPPLHSGRMVTWPQSSVVSVTGLVFTAQHLCLL